MVDKPPSDTLSAEEVMLKIRELRRKAGRKKPAARLLPGASEELWPGGPSVDTNDIRLAARRRAVRREAAGGIA